MAAPLQYAAPKLQVTLYKTVARKKVDGKTPVSERYSGKDESIDLTPFLGDGASVRTTKGVREAAGAFAISFSDMPSKQYSIDSGWNFKESLESIYGLIEPMDVIEIRMWSGLGKKPAKLPIIMRGFVSDVGRQQTMGQDGRPQRSVTVSGQDWGKIWQIYQIVYMNSYAESNALLSDFKFSELFGGAAFNTLPAPDFVAIWIDKVLNPYLDGMLPKWSDMPRQLLKDVTVKHGVTNLSQEHLAGSAYEVMKRNLDIGTWNELYTEDREDGVYCVYRAIPALAAVAIEAEAPAKLQDDAPDPQYADVFDDQVKSLSTSRSDANVANFFWVQAPRFELIDDVTLLLMAIPKNAPSVFLQNEPNSDKRLYGLRPMYSATQMGDDATRKLTSGLPAAEKETRQQQTLSWIDKRRAAMMAMNKDNVVFERGTATVKGGLTRRDNVTIIRAGDYAEFSMGRISFIAYITQVQHEFIPFQGYTTTLSFERGTGFINRIKAGQWDSPYLAEQAPRAGNRKGL